METFDISVDGFSGPLDLLCSLVESRQMEASRIKVAHLVRIYGAYLARTRRASVETIAEFFFMVAGLLLEKTHALLPGEAPPSDEDDVSPADEEAFLETLARDRPYREASRWLWEKLERESRSFRRVAGEGAQAPSGEVEYDIGDLYFLSRVWWGLFERYTRSRSADRRMREELEDADWDGFTESPPDEAQIETRIEELEGCLERENEIFLSVLCRAARSIKLLVVTLLALLEMCRMGKISIEQEAIFADVKILAKPGESRRPDGV